MNDTAKPLVPFKRINIELHFHIISQNSVFVTWALNREYTAPGPYKFTLYRARSANGGSMTEVAEVIDQPFMYDYNPLFGTHEKSVYYSVRLIDGLGKEYWSTWVPIEQYWDHKDWLLAREIIRKETLLLKKKVGTKGYLLKRKLYGDLCPDCVDPNTLQVMDPNCTTCYGTGLVGGYYPALEMWVIQNPSQNMVKLTSDQGVVTANIETVRSLAYPQADPNDVWVNANTNVRSRVLEDCSAVARHRGIDLIMNIRVEELPSSSSVYSVVI